MSACTFFGHGDCPETKYSNILQAIQNLIKEKNITTFYVGTQGNFDSLVYRALCCLRADYPQISNQWMIERSVYVIAYVTHNFGGAARFVDEAKRKGKTVINL